eukprot:jgi/Hompol1/6590/HPOL_003164-RA
MPGVGAVGIMFASHSKDWISTAQRCYCGESVCSGFIGGKHVDDDIEEDAEDAEEEDSEVQLDSGEIDGEASSSLLTGQSESSEMDVDPVEGKVTVSMATGDTSEINAASTEEIKETGDENAAVKAEPKAPRKKRQSRPRRCVKAKEIVPVKVPQPITCVEQLTDIIKELVSSQNPDDALFAMNCILPHLLRKFINFHGLVILKNNLTLFFENSELVNTILTILKRLPIATKNSTEKLQPVIMSIMQSETTTQEIKTLANERWSNKLTRFQSDLAKLFPIRF